MNIFLSILGIVILVLFTLSKRIKYLRFKNICKLKGNYEEIEFYFIKNKIQLTEDYISFLETLQNLAVNHNFLDIHVLLISKQISDRSNKMDKDKKWFDNTLNSLPDDFQVLFQNFDRRANRIIDLSHFKPDFVWFVTKCLVIHFFRSGFNSFTKFRNDIVFAKNNEGAITYSTMNTAA